MNPLVAQQVKLIVEGIEDLKAELGEVRKQLDEMTRLRNDLQRNNWALGKEIAVYKERLEALAEIKIQNQRLTDQSAEFEERLQRILSCADTLRADLQP